MIDTQTLLVALLIYFFATFVIVMWFWIPFIITLITSRHIKNPKWRIFFKVAAWSFIAYSWLFVGMLILYTTYPPVSERIGAFDAAVRFCTSLNVLYLFIPIWLGGIVLLSWKRIEELVTW